MTDKQTFTQWWVGGLVAFLYGLKCPSTYIAPEFESVAGFMVVGVVASVALSIALSPWWLVVTIPGGILLFLHGLWRDEA